MSSTPTGSWRFRSPSEEVSSITARPADPQNPLPVFTVDNPLAQSTRLARNNRNGASSEICATPPARCGSGIRRSSISSPAARWLKWFIHGGKSVHLMCEYQPQRDRPVPAAAAGLPANLFIPATGQRQYLRLTRQSNYKNALQGAAGAPLRQRVFRPRFLHVAADADRPGYEQRWHGPGCGS